jgi:tetratricopeptide (TPR) repeat protein
MRLNRKWLAVLLVLAVIPLSGCGFMQKLKARDNLNKGVKAFTEMKYDAAAQFFEKSIALDPELEDAQMYLATAYTSQFVPGSADPKSEEMAHKGIETFEKVVANSKNPASENSMNAMLSIASLYYQLKNYKESKAWCNRVLKVNPQNADAYYRIAVIDFDDVFEKTGVQGENVEYMTPEEKTEALANVDEGLSCLNKALEIRPTYFDAMEYQNLLWREKAKFEKDEAAKAELIHEADMVAQKALALRLKAQEEEAKKPKKLGLTGK